MKKIKRIDEAERRLGLLNISDKRADTLRLRMLSTALRAQRMTLPKEERFAFADALDRYLAGYAPPPNRPSEEERNFWLAVGYEIRIEQPKAHKSKLTRVSEELSAEYAEKLGIKLGATAIRKLRSQHPDAARDAKRLIDDAKDRFATGSSPWDPSSQKAFTDPYEAAFSRACWNVQIIMG